MAFTQTQLDALDAAIAAGAKEVWYGHKKVQYRSLEEMIKIRDLMAAQLPSATPQRGPRRRVARFNSGY